MVNHLRNEVHKALYRLNFDQCKKLLEVDENVARKIKKCKNNIFKLSSSLKEIEEVCKAFNEDDEMEEDDNNNEQNKKNNDDEENENDDNDN